MSAINRLELVDVITAGQRHLVHVFYDRYFQGAIHEAASGWRAKLHPVDLGDFHAVDEAKQAVAKWFSELDECCCENQSESDIAESSDAGVRADEDLDFDDTQRLGQELASSNLISAHWTSVESRPEQSLATVA